MSTDRDVTRIVRSWLEEGVTTLPDRVLDDVLDRVPETPQRRSWWPARRFAQMNNVARLAIAAAAVVVVAIAGYNLLPGSSGPGGPNSTPTASPSLAPSPTHEPTPAMTFPALFSTHPGGQALLTPGDWIITAVEPLSITITVPERWYKGAIEWAVFPDRSGSSSVAFMAVDNLFVDPCDTAKGMLESPPGPSVDDLAAAMSRVPGIDASEPTDVTLAGYEGKYVELSKPASAEPCGGGVDATLWLVAYGEGPRDAPAPAAGETNRYWIVDVNGTRLVVGIVASAITATRSAEAQAIVDSIQIEP